MIGSDFLYAMICFAIISMVAVSMIYVSQNVTPILAKLPNYNTPYTPATSNTPWLSPLAATIQILNNYNSVDGWIYFIFILVNLAIIASCAFLPNVSPMAIAIGFLTMIVVVIVSFILSNALNTFFGANILANAVAKLPNVRILWANIGEMEILFSLIYLIAVAARSRGGGGTGGYGGSKVTIGGF